MLRPNAPTLKPQTSCILSSSLSDSKPVQEQLLLLSFEATALKCRNLKFTHDVFLHMSSIGSRVLAIFAVVFRAQEAALRGL